MKGPPSTGKFEKLGAHSGGVKRRPQRNNDSCVLKVGTGSQSLLLPGDSETVAERELVVTHNDGLAASVLVAPHHGSNTSSSFAFLKAVNPRLIVIPAGYHNAFGHPHPLVMGRYQRLGIESASTAASGMLKVDFSEADFAPRVSGYRESVPRYWRPRPASL